MLPNMKTAKLSLLLVLVAVSLTDALLVQRRRSLFGLRGLTRSLSSEYSYETKYFTQRVRREGLGLTPDHRVVLPAPLVVLSCVFRHTVSPLFPPPPLPAGPLQCS